MNREVVSRFENTVLYSIFWALLKQPLCLALALFSISNPWSSSSSSSAAEEERKTR